MNVTETLHTMVNCWNHEKYPMTKKHKEFIDRMVVEAFWCEPIGDSDRKELRDLYQKALSSWEVVPLSDMAKPLRDMVKTGGKNR